MRQLSELNPHNYKTNSTIDRNLVVLFSRLGELQKAFGKEFTVTSGLRSAEKQQALIDAGKTNARFSLHLAGAAADILDSDGALAEYCKSNLKLLEVIGLWIEDVDVIAKLAKQYKTDRWVHFQILAPRSGKRMFIP